MPQSIKIAVTQMDATLSATSERLQRAETIIEKAVASLAQIVVLPELFNTGYAYHDQNYALAETLDGETAQWMRDQAQRHGIYLLGSLLLKDNDHVYNTALLFAPDRRYWRYDKQYPFIWERAYFRDGHGITIADTDLGKFGLMICWDSAHADLWQRYAGQVDAMLITSCPPRINQARLVLSNGERISFANFTDLGHFADDLEANAKWMGVPVVHSSGSGEFRSHLPASTVSVASYLVTHPQYYDQIQFAHDACLEADFGNDAIIVDKAGETVACITQDGDAFAIAEVELPDSPPQPKGEQPKTQVNPIGFWVSDVLSPPVFAPIYRRGLKRQWGKQMAPLDHSTKVWTGFAIFALVLGWLLGRALPRK